MRDRKRIGTASVPAIPKKTVAGWCLGEDGPAVGTLLGYRNVLRSSTIWVLNAARAVVWVLLIPPTVLEGEAIGILKWELLDCFSIHGIRSRGMKSNLRVNTACDPIQVKPTPEMSRL